MAGASDSQEHRRDALTAFLDARVSEGYRVETRTDTHAIIAPAERGWPLLVRLRRGKTPERQVISVDQDGVVTMRPAEPLRSRAPMTPPPGMSRSALEVVQLEHWTTFRHRNRVDVPPTERNARMCSKVCRERAQIPAVEGSGMT